MTAALHELGAAEAVALLARGEISAEELARACLDRIAARERQIGAWQAFEAERALAEARRRDAEGRKPPLFGLPVGIKDLIDTADLPTEYGTELHRGHRPAKDAACVSALRAAGAVILGKTVTTELAYFTPGKTRNPVDPSRTPGGSSSGSAAAVADAMVPAALGTQTAGSVIRPAAFCGAIGYKPTFGAWPMEGIKPLAASLDTLGVFARRIEDLPLLAAALGTPFQVTSRDRPPRVAICRTEQWPAALPETQALIDRAADALGGAGAGVAELRLPPPFAGLFEAQKAIMAAEIAASLQPERARGEAQLGEPLRALLREGDAARASGRYQEALARAEACRSLFPQAVAAFDVIVTPAAPGEAPVGLGSTGDPVFNRIWTLLHAPCIALPAGRGPHGMPLALQLVAAPGADVALISCAAWVGAHIGEVERQRPAH